MSLNLDGHLHLGKEKLRFRIVKFLMRGRSVEGGLCSSLDRGERQERQSQ